MGWNGVASWYSMVVSLTLILILISLLVLLSSVLIALDFVRGQFDGTDKRGTCFPSYHTPKHNPRWLKDGTVDGWIYVVDVDDVLVTLTVAPHTSFIKRAWLIRGCVSGWLNEWIAIHHIPHTPLYTIRHAFFRSVQSVDFWPPPSISLLRSLSPFSPLPPALFPVLLLFNNSQLIWSVLLVNLSHPPPL
jgi:hypothetical protein